MDKSEFILTKEGINEYLNARSNSISENSYMTYRAKLTQLYDLLPGDKRMTSTSIDDCARALLENGNSEQTVNTFISIADSFVTWYGRKDLLSTKRYEAKPTPQPELSRNEYLRLLSAAKLVNDERAYLIIKTITLTGANLQELLAVTLDDVQSGKIKVSDEYRKLPEALIKELADYAKRIGATSGPIFRSYSGAEMTRSNVTRAIQPLSKVAKVESEKCTPRALRKLYLDTREKLTEMAMTLVDQATERMIDKEQQVSGWL